MATMTTTTTSVAAPSDLRARFHDVRTVTERLARELPGDLDAEGRLVLARRLVREGFLRIRGA